MPILPTPLPRKARISTARATAKRIKYRLKRLRCPDRDFSAVSDKQAIQEGFRIAGAQHPYSIDTFMLARGIGIYRLPDEVKIYPPETN